MEVQPQKQETHRSGAALHLGKDGRAETAFAKTLEKIMSVL